MNLQTLLFALVLAAPSPASEREVTVETRSGHADEVSVQQQLQRLLTRNDLSRFAFTGRVLIDRSAIPHSHPVLTLHTRHIRDDDLLLATYLHEQIHWFLSAREHRVSAAMLELRQIFPVVPASMPDGADSQSSTYLHILVNALEYRACKDIMGELRAKDVFEFWADDHYRWIYRQVLERERDIVSVLRRHDLLITGGGPVLHPGSRRRAPNSSAVLEGS